MLWSCEGWTFEQSIELGRSTRSRYGLVYAFEFTEFKPQSVHQASIGPVKSGPAVHVWSMDKDGETPPGLQSHPSHSSSVFVIRAARAGKASEVSPCANIMRHLPKAL